jgi:hypothetical protein
MNVTLTLSPFKYWWRWPDLASVWGMPFWLVHAKRDSKERVWLTSSAVNNLVRDPWTSGT